MAAPRQFPAAVLARYIAEIPDLGAHALVFAAWQSAEFLLRRPQDR